MDKRHYIALADGSVFYGQSCGAPTDAVGEAVFNTGQTGYQEIVSDPSYAGQCVVLTASEIGNYGCCALDMESRALFLSGLIVRQMNEPSNWRSEESLSDLLRRFNKPALCRVDTRRLVLHLRQTGSQKAFLHAGDRPIPPDEGVARAKEWVGLDGIDTAATVSDPNESDASPSGEGASPQDGPMVVAYDFGIKRRIVHSLKEVGFRVRVVPAWTTADEVLAMKPDALFLSNGPGDPVGVRGGVESVKRLLGRLPIMGICLGHQILALACGAETGRLKFGHHGCNHPVKNLLDDTVAITSQNHNFAVVRESLSRDLELTHINLNDGTVEGIRHKTLGAFSVQFHPEAAPGPHDAKNLFRQFRETVK